MTRKTPTVIGAAVGLALFLALGLLPSLLYGGYAGVMIASGFAGAPVKATFLARALIVSGMVLGATGTGALFTIAGGAIGAVVAALVGVPAGKGTAKGAKA